MISLKSEREIRNMRQAATILKKVFLRIQEAIKPGITTEELDRIAEDTILSSGGKPAFKGYRGFPKSICTSLNEEVVHGIPGPRRLKEGDLISIDAGVTVAGYHADAARTWGVGKIDPEKQRLMDTPREALISALRFFQPGARIGDLSFRIQTYIESQGFGVVRDYVGHGIGRELHEDPQVPNYGKPGHGPRIEAGLVLAIEPMVTAGHYAVEVLPDGWTVVTRDRKLSSHYEDTIAFTDSGYENLTGGNE